jgi:hypothetical protein
VGGRRSTRSRRRRRVSRSGRFCALARRTHHRDGAARQTVRRAASTGAPARRSHRRRVAQGAVCSPVAALLRGQDQLCRRDQPLRWPPDPRSAAGSCATRTLCRDNGIDPGRSRWSRSRPRRTRAVRDGATTCNLDNAGYVGSRLDQRPVAADVRRRRRCHPCRAELHRRRRGSATPRRDHPAATSLRRAASRGAAARAADAIEATARRYARRAPQ